jgi:hypothetical protein
MKTQALAVMTNVQIGFLYVLIEGVTAVTYRILSRET